MIYRLEDTTGNLYTEEEYWDKYKNCISDRDIAATCWDKLPAVEVPLGKLEEVRTKLLYLYGHPLDVGSIISDSLFSPDNWFVISTDPSIEVIHTKTKEVKRWQGLYVVRAGSPSFRESIAGQQAMYNKANNHKWKKDII